LLARAVLAQQDKSTPSPVARRRSDAEVPELIDPWSSYVEPNRPASTGAGQAGHVPLAKLSFEAILRVAARDTGDPRSPPIAAAAYVSVGVADADLGHLSLLGACLPRRMGCRTSCLCVIIGYRSVLSIVLDQKNGDCVVSMWMRDACPNRLQDQQGRRGNARSAATIYSGAQP